MEEKRADWKVMTEMTQGRNSARERSGFKITRWLMSAAVISSLVRCDEWDRKQEKKDKTQQEQKENPGGADMTRHLAVHS